MGFFKSFKKKFKGLSTIEKLFDPGGHIRQLQGEDPDLAGASEDAFRREMLRLERVRQQKEREAEFSAEEGEGLARTAEFEFGDQFDLEDLTQEQRTERSSGRLAKENTDTGLIL